MAQWQRINLQRRRRGSDLRIRKDPLEKKMATHSRILAWEIPWTEEPGGLHTVHGVAKESDMTEHECTKKTATTSL